MSVITRFAPSPTGHLHVGNARIAIANALLSLRDGGRFVLRYDDTDTERSRDEYADSIAEDLAWLGIEWDEVVRQSARLDEYRAAASKLEEAGRLYKCYETREELELKRKHLLASKQPPIYDRAALALSDDERAALEAEGRRAHWRFKLAPGEITWTDLVRGPQHYDAANVSDPVLIREDGTFLYTLPSVVDDMAFGVTHIVRGEDHVTNTAVQLQIMEALGGTPANLRFAHLPLLVGPQGEPLSKRLGTASLREMRDDGLEPMALASMLAALGTSEAVTVCHDFGALAATFSLAHVSRNSPRFDASNLWPLNAQLLHETPFSAVADRLGLPDADDAFWVAVRGNIDRLAGAREWWEICHEPLTPVPGEPDFLKAAAAVLPPAPWDGETFRAWAGAVKAATGRKGKALFRPLRVALTGRDHGPELHSLLPLIGRDRTLKRLSGEVA